MPAAAEALAAFERNLRAEGAPPPEAFLEALRGLMGRVDHVDPSPGPL